MRVAITTFMVFSALLAYSQEYPKIEMDQKKEKVVVFSFEQARMIDNKLEILDLLEKSRVQCDSLNITRIGVIDSQNRQISLMDNTISELKSQVSDKDSQIDNQKSQIKNLGDSNMLCDEQKSNKDKQITGLEHDIKREKIKKWLYGGGGVLIGLIIALL